MTNEVRTSKLSKDNLSASYFFNYVEINKLNKNIAGNNRRYYCFTLRSNNIPCDMSIYDKDEVRIKILKNDLV